MLKSMSIFQVSGFFLQIRQLSHVYVYISETIENMTLESTAIL